MRNFRFRQKWLTSFLVCFLSFLQIVGGYISPAQAANGGIITLANQSLQKASYAFLGKVANTDDSNAIIRYLIQQPSSTGYIQGVQSEVKGNQGNYSSYNTLAKRIVGWTAAGQDATNIDGTDLIVKLSTLPTDSEGRWNNELVWGLFALDSKGYAVSANAVGSRDSMIRQLVDSQVGTGGWDLVVRHAGEWKKAISYDSNYQPNGYGTSTTLDIDMTGMALTALAPYKNDSSVSDAVYHAVEQLKLVTLPTNSDSISQMIIGLSSVGMDPTQFNGQNLVQQLLTYQLSDGMFKYDNSSWGSGPNSYATNDALTALAAYLKFSKTNTDSPIYYHMSVFYGDPIQQGTNSFLSQVAETDDSNAIIRFLTGQQASIPYIQSVQTEVQGNQGNYSSYNKLAKKILGLTAAGQDATNISGMNLIQKLGALPTDSEERWNNELIWGLLALDSKGYSLSADAVGSRQALMTSILQSKLSTGGWDLVIRHDGEWKKPTYDSNYMPNGYETPTTLDIDMTGMALTALAPYQDDATVTSAVYDAVQALRRVTPTNSDSLSQMVIGLSAVGVDPSNFNGRNLVQQLLTYQLAGGMFKYDDSSWGSTANSFATNDALTALIAYQKFAENRTANPIYYHMSGVALSNSNSGSKSSTQQTIKTGTITLTVTGDHQHGTIMPATEVQLQDGDTAFSVLVRTLSSSQIKYKSYSGSLYVQAIDGINEFDHGPQSGWIFLVNGIQSQISASDYQLTSGDRLEWKYSGEIANLEQNSQTATSLDSATQSLSLAVDNHKSIQQVAKTVVVLNQDQKMNEQAIQQLARMIKENEVNLQQAVNPANGSTISDPNQIVEITIPQQALKQSVTIGIKELTSENRKEALSPLYEFTPIGQTFDKPIDISLRVPLTVKDLNQVAMVWLNEQTNEWVPIPAVVDAKTGTVTGRVNHFTKFAVIDRDALNGSINIDQAIDAAVKKVMDSDSLSDWSAFALARAGQTLPVSYMANMKATLDQNQGSFHNVTDFERMVLGVLAAGEDPLNSSGYNMIEKIYNNERLTSQGANGVIFGLIALDSKNYPVQDNALWTRDKMVNWLLKNQNQDGGWSIVSGDASDIDITSMAIAALAPYQNREEVKKATDAAIHWMVDSIQQPVTYSESIAQEIEGLAALGLNPIDPKFNRSGKDLISCLLQFQQADGGFAHQMDQGTNPIATEQALVALEAYQFYVKGQGSIYQFTTSKSVETGNLKETADYIDVDQISSWAVQSVKKARDYNLMKGVSAATPTFAPKQSVTRAEFTAVMMRLLGKKLDGGEHAIFDDVLPTDWYYNDVMVAKEDGIIHGITDTIFAPNTPVTREQMATIIANAYHLQGKDGSAIFKDQEEISSYALPAIEALYDQGIMLGFDGKIDPQGNATREMVASLAVKLYESQHN
ncbi:MAG TPA: S-layer homology domain-containing protein [Bacillota bacterium]|nr:S-layer homology domain-containing protein [Bacillota bacterium]